ncbi:hypothetical protein C5167_039648 [Papaver somniferum]|uniref:Uncharacterized protein n=1 Tax=Papaver somniferum TaxID=3469 RepID=A0A4Y7IGU4_PAPSO|nr:hypothetical protein C5167_039648 [Papaver somniferum]
MALKILLYLFFFFCLLFLFSPELFAAEIYSKGKTIFFRYLSNLSAISRTDLYQSKSHSSLSLKSICYITETNRSSSPKTINRSTIHLLHVFDDSCSSLVLSRFVNF